MLVLLVVLGSLCGCTADYIAAAVQLAPLGNYQRSPAENIALNLRQFERAAESAKERNADIIVYPEAVLWTFGLSNRQGMVGYGEVIRNSSLGYFCEDENQSLQLRTLSCIAANNSLVVVANMISIVPCTSQSPDCPADGQFLFNTEVAFSERGQLIQVYYKEHIFGTSPILNQPAVRDPKSFTTSFGVTFGMVVCYDMEFVEPTRTLLQQNVRHFVTSMSWMNDPPLFSAVMFQQGWSRRYNVTLIAANRADSGMNSGGGIFLAGEPAAVWFNESAVQALEIVIAKVPTDDTLSPIKSSLLPPAPEINDVSAVDDATHMPLSLAIPRDPVSNCTTFASGGPVLCRLFAAAPGTTITRTISLGGLTCSMSASVASDSPPDGIYALLIKNENMVFPGTPDRLSVEVCAVVHCGGDDNTVACEPAWRGPTVFDTLLLSGSFSAGITLPMLANETGGVMPPSAVAFNPAGVLDLQIASAITSIALYSFPYAK